MRGVLIHGYCRRGKPVHPLYSTWAGMMQRCYYRKHISWKWYGAKGIHVCLRWHKFKFFAEDMEPGWKRGLTIERINNDLGYSLENCRWATTHEQRMNDSHGKKYTFRGQTKRLSEWAKEIGVTYQAMRQRFRLGWSRNRIFTVKDGRTT